jgi:hypothetical protein
MRCKIPDAVMAKLEALQAYWGYGHKGDAVAQLIVEAHARHLSRTHWEQQQAHGWRVLKRLKPEVLLAKEEITGVSFLDGGDRVCIHVALNAQPYQVSRREWEK